MKVVRNKMQETTLGGGFLVYVKSSTMYVLYIYEQGPSLIMLLNPVGALLKI